MDGMEEVEQILDVLPKGTTLKMPKDEESLKVLLKSWKKITEHLDAVNELTKGIEDFSINYTSPEAALTELAKRGVEKEKSWVRKTCTSYVSKHVVDSFDALHLLRREQSDTKSNRIYNEKLDTFFDLVQQHKMKKEVGKIIKDRQTRLERETERMAKANSNFLKMRKDSSLILANLKEATKAETFKAQASRAIMNEEMDTKKPSLASGDTVSPWE